MNKSLASKVVRTPDRVASKVAVGSRSPASKVVRTLDRVASKVAADSRSRASSLDSVNFSFYENPFPASRRDFFILISDAGSKYIMRETSLRFD